MELITDNFVVVPSRPAVTVRVPAAPRINPRGLLVQVVCAAGPAMGLLVAGQVEPAGYCFWLVFAVLLVRLLARGRLDEALCLTVGLAPVINLLRDFAMYNIVVVLLGGLLTWYGVQAPQTVWRIWRRYRLTLVLLGGVSAYYALSFAITGKYEVNLRLFELGFTVLSLLLIGRHRVLLGVTLAGISISAVAVGIALLQHMQSATAGRLGMIVLSGHVLGNPTQLGLPLALAFLALVIDRGQWLGLGAGKFWRWLLLALTFLLLALTSSRASWSVAAMGLAVSLVLGNRQRLRILLLIGLAAGGVQLVLLSPYGEQFARGLERTFSSERTAAQRSSGRSDQWLVAQHAFLASPARMLVGYGPGNGGAVYARLSQEIEGIKYAVGHQVALHSLFMQVLVEAGTVGLVFLVGWLVAGLVKTAAWTRRHKVMFPLVCFLGYMVVVVTVSGNDIISGVMLGTGLLTTGQPSARQIGRKA